MKSYIYLSSFAFSGSTLLSFLMDSHPNIASVGELCGPLPHANMDSYRCSCGVRLVDCKFWLEVRRQMEKRKRCLGFHNFQTTYYMHTTAHFIDKIFLYTFNSIILNYTKDAFFRLDMSRAKYIKQISERCVAMANIITRLKGCENFFDASKGYNALKYLSNHMDIDFKVISLHRDARGIIFSYLKRNPGMATEVASKIWSKSMKRREAVIKNYIEPEQLLRIKYEELCKSPEATLFKIYKFIGVEKRPFNLPLQETDHHILGNKMRLDLIHGIKLDEKWRTELREEQKSLINAIAGNQNRIYGYD